ncbi:MAG: hypothetical protein JNJ72_00750 [Anaerolineales bacterium]|nr:hypothetical protein [Anaerolineales bacterium]
MAQLYTPYTLRQCSHEMPRRSGRGIRGGKSAYWCSFGEAWEGRLLEVLGRL